MNCASFADSSPVRLTDTKAAEAFVSSAEVVVIGFLEVRGRRLYTKKNIMNRGQKYAFRHLINMPTRVVLWLSLLRRRAHGKL